ncbi:rhomboid family intramembrane serine protease [Jatrophihabitans sp. YIM 134969]
MTKPPRYTLKQRWSDALAANPRVESTRPIGWGQAMAVMAGLTAVLWIVEIVNVSLDYRLNRFGLEPRTLGGLWGVLTMPFLHVSAYQLLAITGPFLLIGWVVLLGGWRSFALISLICFVVSGVLTWLIAPSGANIVGVSPLVFGWLGYICARAVFSRRIAWIASAIVVLILFGSMFFSLIPETSNNRNGVPWEAHMAGVIAGLLAGWLLHPRKSTTTSVRFAKSKSST